MLMSGHFGDQKGEPVNTRHPAWPVSAVAVLIGFLATSFGPAFSDDSDAQIRSFDAERLAELILKVDDEAILEGSTWYFHVEGLETAVVYDVGADRMRIIIPIGPSDDLDEEQLLRMMQANFDSALDARYAVAQGMIWGAYIHPLSTLTDEEFLVGLGETVNVVLSYGSDYTSGLFMYGNGDSAEIERKRVIERLKNATT